MQNKTIQDFSAEFLPNLSAEYARHSQDLAFYFRYGKSQKLKEKFNVSLSNAFKTEMNLSLKEMILLENSDSLARLSEHDYIVTISILPMGVSAFLILDRKTIGILKEILLVSRSAKVSEPLEEELSELSFLQKGVVQYAIVNFLFQMNKHKSLGFQVLFEKLEKASEFSKKFENLNLFYSGQVQNKGNPLDFRFVMPLSFFNNAVLQDYNQSFFEKRIEDFHQMKSPFELEVGKIELEQSDVDALEEGDIILFDETDVTLQNRTIAGNLKIKPVNGYDDSGFCAEICKHHDETIELKILNKI